MSAPTIDVVATRDVLEWVIAEADRAAIATDNVMQALHDAKHQAPPEVHEALVANADLIAGAYRTATLVRSQLRALHRALAGHVDVSYRDDAGTLWPACTCGWRADDGYYGDKEFITDRVRDALAAHREQVSS